MPRTPSARTRVKKMVQAALALHAEDITVLDLQKLASFSDFFVICSGTSDRQVQAIADAIEKAMGHFGARLLGKEGYVQGQWILLDYGDVVAHIFYPAVRELYQIEKLWADAPKLQCVGA